MRDTRSSPTNSQTTDNMPIGVVSRATGLPASTLRYFESEKLLSPPRGSGGQRRYRLADLKRIQFVQRAQSVGFSIAECRTLLRGLDRDKFSQAWRKLVEEKIVALDKQLEEVNRMRGDLASALRCACDDAVDCTRAAENPPPPRTGRSNRTSRVRRKKPSNKS